MNAFPHASLRQLARGGAATPGKNQISAAHSIKRVTLRVHSALQTMSGLFDWPKEKAAFLGEGIPMFNLRIVARSLHLLAASVVVCVALPAAAQTFQVANSTAGRQVTAAPINQIVANLNAGINNAQWTATVANNQANYATQVGNNAQATANWAGDVANYASNTAADAWNRANNAQATANNAQATANAVAGRVDATWNLAIADCALAMGGVQWIAFCQAVNPRPW